MERLLSLELQQRWAGVIYVRKLESLDLCLAYLAVTSISLLSGSLLKILSCKQMCKIGCKI